MPKSKAEDKEYAKLLYLDRTKNLTQKEIAKRCNVRPNTVGDWIKKGGWEKMRKSLILTKQETIVDMYDQLNLLINHIKERKLIYDIPVQLLKPVKIKDADGNETLELPTIDHEDFPVKISNYPTSKEANQIAVLTSSIKKLETEASVAEVIDVSRAFLEWIKNQDFDFHKKLVPFFDAFITTKL